MIRRFFLRLFAATACSALAAAARPEPQAAASAPPPAKAAGQIPLENFAQLPFLESPRLSPDGTKIAVKIAVDGQQLFAIVPIGDSSGALKVGLADTDLNAWDWVNNDWIVAKVGATGRLGDQETYIRRTMAISADGKVINVLGKNMAGQVADDVLWIAQDGSPHVRLAMQTSIFYEEPGFWPEVRDFDIATGRSKAVQQSVEKVFDWYADPAGTVRYGVAYDDNRRSYNLLYRSGEGASFKTISRARGDSDSLGKIPAVFLPEADRAIVYDDESGFDALYNFDLATFKTGEKIFAVPGYDIAGIITGGGGSRLVGVRFTDTRPRTHWFDPALAKVQEEIDRSVGIRTAQIVSYSRNFDTLIVLVGGADRPGSYYIYQPAIGVMRFLSNANTALGSGAQSPVSTIRYRARDGLEISAVLTVPKGATAKNLPLIMMPHGGPFARDAESWDWWAQFVASRGYAVLQPNYRGSSGYGEAFEAKGKGQWGLAMQDDLDDGVQWAVSSGLADAKRVCIVGGSYGGFAAFRAAQRNAGIYRCAVSFAGVSDLPAMLRYNSQFLNAKRSKDYLREQAPDLRGVSPINDTAPFAIPVLIVHGKKDRTVPVGQSRSIVAKLKAGAKPHRYVEQPLGDHHLSRQADREEFLRELESFLQVNNPA